MINIHGQGYYAALAPAPGRGDGHVRLVDRRGPRVHGGKLHGAAGPLTETLKGKMGFDGLVVSDWNGIGQVRDARRALRRRPSMPLDIVIVPNKWKLSSPTPSRSSRRARIPMSASTTR